MFRPQVDDAAASSPFGHLLSDEHQRVLFYNLSVASERQFQHYKRLCCYMLLALATVVCFAVYQFTKHREESAFANPALELLQLHVKDSLRDQYSSMRKKSWIKPEVPVPDSTTATAVPASAPPVVTEPEPAPVNVATRQLQHDGRLRKEHRRQKKSSFAR